MGGAVPATPPPMVAGAGFSQDPQQLGSPQREREPRVPPLSGHCSPRCGRAHTDAPALGLVGEPSSWARGGGEGWQVKSPSPTSAPPPKLCNGLGL